MVGLLLHGGVPTGGPGASTCSVGEHGTYNTVNVVVWKLIGTDCYTNMSTNECLFLDVANFMHFVRQILKTRLVFSMSALGLQQLLYSISHG